MPQFSGIPAQLRERIIDMTSWRPTNAFIALAVNKEWYSQLAQLVYDVDPMSCGDEEDGGSECYDWREEEDEGSECYDWRDEEYSDSIKIDGIRHHGAVFYSCGSLKRLND